MSAAGLAERGIHLRDRRAGEHRSACPECAKTKVRPRDSALAVRLDPAGGATWHCHRCAWSGTIGADRRQHERRPPPRPAPPKPDRAAALQEAMALWESAKPITADTPAGRYLEARGCALPHSDGDLRFVEGHRHPCGWQGPCLVALVTDAITAEPLTVHGTWIQPDGRKAPVERPRLLWPSLPKAGGVCRLWPDEAITLGLLVAEGVETALTAAAGFGLAWSCLDAGNLKALPVLPGIDVLTITADHDPAGLAAAEACAARWAEAGVEVRLWRSPTAGHDMNDYAREKAA